MRSVAGGRLHGRLEDATAKRVIKGNWVTANYMRGSLLRYERQHEQILKVWLQKLKNKICKERIESFG
jgi:hypothetical protein